VSIRRRCIPRARGNRARHGVLLNRSFTDHYMTFLAPLSDNIRAVIAPHCGDFV
jgi:hypothetical protein